MRLPVTVPVMLLVALLVLGAVGCGWMGSDDAADPPATGGAVGSTAPDPRCGPDLADQPASAHIDPKPGPASITGTVTDGGCGRPIANVSVWLLRDRDRSLIGSTTTDDTGSYRFPSIGPGAYRLTFQDPGWAYVSIYYPDGPDFESGKTIELTANAVQIDEKLYTPDTQPVPDVKGTPTTPRRTIVAIGDSLIQQTTTILQGKLQAIAPSSVRGIAQQRTDQLMPVARQYAALNPRPTDVVIALGNNDIRQNRTPGQTRDSIRTMIDLFPQATCVTIVNINSHTASDEFNAGAAQLNPVLADLTHSDPRFRLVDWDADVALLQQQGQADSTWFTDGLHLNATGEGAYGSAIAGTVAQCPR